MIEKDDGNRNWGVKTAACAERAKGDYLFCAADDIDVRSKWWQAATAVCDRGLMPAPLVFNTDGSIQSCGEWEKMLPDNTVVPWSRFPFLSRSQWERFGPTLPIHYSDVILGERAARAGVLTVVCQRFSLYHHFAAEGRKDNDVEELRRRVAHQLDAQGVDLWDPENLEAINNCTPQVVDGPDGPSIKMVRP